MDQKVAERTAADDVASLRSEVDLGLRFAEALVRAGDAGSALRLVEELRVDTARVLDLEARQGDRRRAVWSRRRRAIAAGGLVAVLGIGSAAALVAPRTADTTDKAPSGAGRRPAPAVVNPAAENIKPPTGQPAEGAEGLTAPEPAPEPGTITDPAPPGGSRRHLPPGDQLPDPTELPVPPGNVVDAVPEVDLDTP
jgi:hypothetical protein